MEYSKETNNKDVFISIFDLWAKRTPAYETHFEKEVIKPLTDFSLGTNEASEAKGKILGAGYEALIMAFFIGLYSNKRIPLSEYADIKDLGQPIQYWGNIENRKGRRAYPKLKYYIFLSLVAKSPDIEWVELDKGKWTPKETVNSLMITMEEYINYGLSYMFDKIKENEGYFYRDDSFLDVFKELTQDKSSLENNDDPNEPESLD